MIKILANALNMNQDHVKKLQWKLGFYARISIDMNR